MARSLRGGRRLINAWPGWVDALSSLVMVVIFLLMIFVVSQFYLATTLTGRDEQLKRLNGRINELTELLNLERDSNADLRVSMDQVSEELRSALTARDDLTTTLSTTRDERDKAARAAAELEKTIKADRETIELRLREAASIDADLKTLREAKADLEAKVAALSLLADGLRKRAEGAEKAGREGEEQRQKLLATVDRERARADTAEGARSKSEDALRLTQQERDALKAALDKEKARGDAAETAKAQTDDALRLTDEQRELLEAQLGVLRDRSKELEAQLADTREKTVLAQRDIDARDIRVKELTDSLGAEKGLSAEAAKRVDALNARIAALKDELIKLNATLEASEKTAADQKVQIVDLGNRLNQALAGKVQELARYRSEFFGRVREALGDRQDVKIVGDRFVFQSELLFPTGQAALQPEGRDRLATLAKSLREVAAKMPGDLNWVLRVDGHTDTRPINTPQFPSNWELSTARAISVARFLMDQGIPPDRLAVAGFGEFHPLDPGNTEEAHAKNRRIELKLDQLTGG